VGCCVGVEGMAGYQPCATEPTTAGFVHLLDVDELVPAYTCDRHAVVLLDPHPLTPDDVEELAGRRWRRQP
jgi:hypothetical protein